MVRSGEGAAVTRLDSELVGDLLGNGDGGPAQGGDHDAAVADGGGGAADLTCADVEAEDDERALSAKIESVARV